MEQRLSIITIGANNLADLKSFYEDVLGWAPVAANKDIVFYKLNGFLLSLCDKKMLADIIGIDAGGEGFRCVTISYNVKTKEDVLTLYEQLKDKVKIIKAPTEPPFGGLFFYFYDAEGNILEVACNDYVEMDEHSNVVHHKPIDNL